MHLMFHPCFVLLENDSAIEHLQIIGHANFCNGGKKSNADNISDPAAKLDFKHAPLLFSPLKSEQSNSSVSSVDLLFTDSLGCVHTSFCSHCSFEVSLFLYDKQLLNFVGGVLAGWNFTMSLIHVVLYLKRQIQLQPKHWDFERFS